MTEDEGSAIFATSILASFRPLSSMKRLAKLFASNQSSKCPFTPVTDASDPFREVSRAQKSETRTSSGSSRSRFEKCSKRSPVLASKNDRSVSRNTSCDHGRDSVKTLVKFDDVPPYLQFNQYVLNGYRPPNMTASQCVASLTYFHNETINIMTHGERHKRSSAPSLDAKPIFVSLLPLTLLVISSRDGLPSLSSSIINLSSFVLLTVVSMIVFGLIMPYTMPWDEIKHPVLAYTCLVGSVSSWVGSSMYHLFMNHHRGEELYVNLLQWDVTGIWVTQAIGASTTIYTSVVCYDPLIQWSLIGVYGLTSASALRDSLMARSAWSRILGFASLFFLRIIAFVLRLQALGLGVGSVSSV